jgi:ABC-type uncharacterized transport system substrate-binding protein/esterase/lipase
MDDIRAVMDAAGSKRAAVLGISEGGSLAALFAATHPDRCQALVMYGAFAKFTSWFPTQNDLDAFFTYVMEKWGSGDNMPKFSPSRRDDQAYRQWWTRRERAAASPSTAIALMQMNSEIDISAVLPSVHVPTLVIHRSHDLVVDISGGRQIAALIPKAQFFEAEGMDHTPWTGDDVGIIAERIEEFLTGSKPAAATTTIPIVFSRVGDPVRYGLVASLPRPGGNATGAVLLTTDLAEKRLQLLKQMIPGITRVGVLHEQNFAPGDIELKQLAAAASLLGLQIQAIGVAPPEPGALESALPDLMKESPEALFVGSSGWFEDVYTHTLGLAAKSRLPALYVRGEYVDAGGLMSYGVNYPDMYRWAVDYVAKILKGAKPSDLPVWQPVKVELVINVRTAKALDLTVPAPLLAFAERVVE